MQQREVLLEEAIQQRRFCALFMYQNVMFGSVYDKPVTVHHYF